MAAKNNDGAGRNDATRSTARKRDVMDAVRSGKSVRLYDDICYYDDLPDWNKMILYILPG